MRLLAILAVVAGLGVTVAACGAPPSGVVVGREYDAPEFKSKKVCTTAAATKRKTCTTKRTIEPAEWELTLRVGGDTTEVDVSRAEYEACTEGETYPACAGGA